MLGQEGTDGPASGGARRSYSRSGSWTDRSPTKTSLNRRPPENNKQRSLLPPLQPLSISKRSAEEWPSAGSDDLGIWPLPQTPRGSINALGSSDSGQPAKEFQFKRDKLAFFDKECSRIAEHIYLGSHTVAKNHELLKQNGITHVLNCVGFVCPEYFKSDFVYKTLWLQDSPTEDITSILYDVFDYFEDVREQGGRVLVHCCQGVSRSTSLVIAYLMWREGQSFEDAFQYVKTARGVTNPNMGFACQLLQCQKRVHAMPASPDSILRMYRMAPHSPYDPLHLVPKMINHPGPQELDSRGAFIIHVPSAIYVWTGKSCNSVMSCNARSAAFQVIRYERVTGPMLSIEEGEEPSEFWTALSNEQLLSSGGDGAEIKKEGALSSESMEVVEAGNLRNCRRKVDSYDQDFEIFHEALVGGVVPPFIASNAGSETSLPARGNGWGRLRRKFASGIMKGLLRSSTWNCDATSSYWDESKVIIGAGNQLNVVDPLSPSSIHPCSPSSCFLNNSTDRDRAKDTLQVMDHSVPGDDLLLPPSPPSTSDSFASFVDSSPKLSHKSPTPSPSSSDYASSFTFSPSSTNWSDLSFMSSRQPSPSSLESTEPFYVNDASFTQDSSSLDKEAVPSPLEAFSDNHTLGGANIYLPLKGSSPSIAERRGSNPPPLMMLPSVNDSYHVHKKLLRSQSVSLPDLSQVHKKLVRSQSFCLPDLDDDVMKDVSCRRSDHANNGIGLKSDADMYSSGGEPQGEINDQIDHGTMLCDIVVKLEVEEKNNGMTTRVEFRPV